MAHDESRPSDALVIAGKHYRSRLLTGTGKFKDLDETRLATEAAAAEIVTVAIRRVNIGQDPNAPSLLDVLPPERYTLLPNTAGCYTAEEAVRTCRLARELLDGHNLTKLEVLGDEKTLYPDVVQTLKAAEQLVADGFEVMVYTSDDPILAKRLEEIGCVAVMPLAAPIGSTGHPEQVQPAGNHRQRQGADHCRRWGGHRLGCGNRHGAGLRWRTDEHRHCRCARPDPDGQRDAQGDRGRTRAFLAGRIPRKRYASASSPVDGVIG